MKKIIVLSFIFFTFISVTAQDLVSTVSVNSVTCNSACDGVITVNAIGGTGGYQYELYDFSMVLIATSTSSIFTNLCAGSFSVYVKDSGNNEYVVNSVVVTEPSVLVSDILVTKEPTFGNNDGEITVNVTGGTPPYEYNISSMSSNQFLSSNVFSDLSAGNYTLFIKDQVGCVLSQEITLENSIPDADGDGVFDDVDPDDDNDGNPDVTDPNPLDPVTDVDVLTVVEGTTGTVNVLSND
ncbi:SprB repeat-containing protein, partial [Tenacibaculum sp. S7007]